MSITKVIGLCGCCCSDLVQVHLLMRHFDQWSSTGHVLYDQVEFGDQLDQVARLEDECPTGLQGSGLLVLQWTSV